MRLIPSAFVHTFRYRQSVIRLIDMMPLTAMRACEEPLCVRKKASISTLEDNESQETP